jgi:hypothetical protein
VRVEGEDVIVTIDAVDEQGQTVDVPRLAESTDVTAVDGGVRIHGAFRR